MNHFNLPCIISFGFIVSFKLFEILCIVVILPGVVDGPCPDCDDDDVENKVSRIAYGWCGKANRSATAAKHISIQTKKFCQPWTNRKIKFRNSNK